MFVVLLLPDTYMYVCVHFVNVLILISRLSLLLLSSFKSA